MEFKSQSAPGYDQRFRQSLPDDRDWQLIENRGGTLLYRDATGIEHLVPSAWYNQATEMCVARWRFYSARCRESAAYKRAHLKTWNITDAERSDAAARELDALAVRIAATGKTGFWYSRDQTISHAPDVDSRTS